MNSVVSLPESICADSVSAFHSQTAFANAEVTPFPAIVPLEVDGQAHPYQLNPPKPHITADGEIIHTVDSLTYLCLMMDAKKAAQQGDLSCCVTPLITRMYHDGEIINLRLVDGKWAANETRVSSLHQRSGLTRTAPKKSEAQNKKDSGHSEEEQIRRAIWHFLASRYAFKIYNDSGLTGEFPTNRPELIRELATKKADRYERIYKKVVLDDVSVRRRTPEQNEIFRNYMIRRVEAIRQGALSVDDPDRASESVEEENARVLRRGRPRTSLAYRPAFTQLWADIELGNVFMLTATDRSRIVRDADLELAFLKVCARHEIKIQGLVDNLSLMDASETLQRGASYFLGTVYENQLEETMTRTFRGHVQRAENMTPYQRLPWWLNRDSSGKIVLNPENAAAVRDIVDYYLDGIGIASIARKMARAGFRVKDRFLSVSTISKTVRRTDRLAGRWKLMGLERDVLPAVISDPGTLAALQEANRTSLARHRKLTDGIKWENHLFTALVKCSCGSHAKAKYQTRGGKKCGEYYGCGKDHRSLDDFPHGAIGEDVLTDFFDELLGTNKNFLVCHISRMLGGSTHFERLRRREELEATLADAERAHQRKAEEIRTEVRGVVKAMGINEDSPHFEITMNGIIGGRTEETMNTIQSVRAALTVLDDASGKDDLAVRLTRPLEETQDWHCLTLLQKNRLLRSLFSKIVVFGRNEGRKIELYLLGIEQPLPTLWLRYVHATKWRLPTVAEWIEDMTTPPDDDTLRGWYRVGKARPFYNYLRDSEKVQLPEYAQMVAALKMTFKDKNWQRKYRPYSKEHLTEFFTEVGTPQEVLAQFDQEWPLYLEAEYALHRERKAREGAQQTASAQNALS